MHCENWKCVKSESAETHDHIHLTAVFQDNLGKPAPERSTILDFTGPRDDRVAVAPAGPYANQQQNFISLNLHNVQYKCSTEF